MNVTAPPQKLYKQGAVLGQYFDKLENLKYLPIIMIFVSFNNPVSFNFSTNFPMAISTFDNAVLNKFFIFVSFESAPWSCVVLSGSSK